MLDGPDNRTSLAKETAELMRLLISASEPSAAAEPNSNSNNPYRPVVRLEANASWDNVSDAIAVSHEASAVSPQPAVTSWAAAGSGATLRAALGSVTSP